MARLLKPGGTIVLQVGTTKDDNENIWPLDIVFFDELVRAGLSFQNRINWPVAHGLAPSKKRLAPRNEVALVFSKGTPLFNPNAARIPQKYPDKRAFRGPDAGKLSGDPLGAWPTDNWGDINHLGHNHPEKTEHPAQFPIAFAKRAILLYSQPGDLIFDPFAGTGTVAIAAIETGRAFSGSDLFYGELRARRIAEAYPDVVCPLTGVTEMSMAVWAAEAKRVEVGASQISEEEEQMQLDLAFGIEPGADAAA
jgi:DNA modification methylase